MWCFLVPVFATVCHRMIPFFTANVLPQVAAFRPWWMLGIMVGAPVVHGLLEAADLSGAVWPVE